MLSSKLWSNYSFELEESLRTINKMTKPLNASVFSEEFFESSMSERKCVHVKIMRNNKQKIPKEVISLKLAVLCII